MSANPIRDTHIDALKGLLVLLMAVGHIPYDFFNIDKSNLLDLLSSFIYFFHMPLFLVISVLFIKTNYVWLGKRAMLILGPYLFWYVFAQKKLLLSDPLRLLANVFWGNWSTLHSTLWFLPALFTLNMLVFLFYKSKNYTQYILLFLSLACFVCARQLMTVHAQIPFGIDIALYMLVLAYLTKTIYKHRETCKNISLWILLTAITLSTLALFYMEPVKTHTPFHAIIDLAQFSVPVTVPGYLAFLGLSCSVFILFLKLPPLHLLSVMGAYSFPIFLLHLKILYEVPKFIKSDSLAVNIVCLLLTFCLAIIAPVLLSKGLMRLSEKFKYIGMVK
jgi:fucose 4-O-acetylase-like acetyltransferase